MRLEKKHFSGSQCVYGFGWISNGAWMMRQEMASNAVLFSCDPEVVAAALGFKSVTKYFAPRQFGAPAEPEKALSSISEAKPLRVSSLLVSGEALSRSGPAARLAFGDDGEVIAFNDAFCKLLGIESGMEIYGSPNGGAYSSRKKEDVQWVLMPMRMDKETLTNQLGVSFLKSVSSK